MALSPSLVADSLGALLAQLSPFLEELGPGPECLCKGQWHKQCGRHMATNPITSAV